MAWARIGVGDRAGLAAAIGAAPRMITPIAPGGGHATGCWPRPATAARRPSAAGYASWPAAWPAALPWPVSGPAVLLRGRGPGQGQVSGGDQQRHRDHAVGVGAEPPEEPEVLDQHPVGQAQHA